MINAEKVYDDYLYDCYIANHQLTEEDWLYYGREEHHVEVPNRDGGLLTPCNSQYLTTYQHWIAGVLQSEVLQKSCFAYVPKSTFKGLLEGLRIKWNNDRINPGEFANEMPYAKRKVNSRSIRVSKKLGRSILVTTPQGKTHAYTSIKLACRAHGLHPGHVREVCQGKRKQHKGYTARYAD
jgi:hypothetical protein